MLADILIKVAGMEKEDRHAYYPRPSIAGPERCIRQMVYWGSGTPEDTKMSDRFVLVLDDSSWHEYLTSDWIQKTAFKLHSQQMTVSVTWQGLTLTGHIDGIITDLLGVDRLHEHKAINHFTWQRYAAGVVPVDYIAQCCLYIKGLQAENPAINEAVLLIKNKNTSQFLEYLIGYDSTMDTAMIKSIIASYGEVAPSGEIFEQTVHSAFAKFEVVDHHIKAGTLPPRPFEYGTDYPCTYCSWQNTCWGEYEKEVEAISNNEADLTELSDSARFYNELGAQIGEMTKQRKEVGHTIKKVLLDKSVRHGKAGEYDIELLLKKVKGYAVEPRTQEELHVKKFKIKGE